jgi:hypothetical protein
MIVTITDFGSFSLDGGVLTITGEGPEFGPELVGDPDFADPGFWSCDGEIVTVAAGVATWNDTAGEYTLAPVSPLSPETGKTYRVAPGIVEYTSGTLRIEFGGASLSFGEEGPAYEDVLSSGGSLNLTTPEAEGFVGVLDGISIREVLG